jgi:hypothetical protein
MNRRTLLQSLGAATTHALFPSILTGFLSGCTDPTDRELLFFTEREFAVLQEMIDLILPATNSASASQVGTQQFIDEVFAKCLEEEAQSAIRAGMSAFIPEFETAGDKFGHLAELDRKAFQYQPDALWFMAVKQYALIGFFTSREGTTVASNYVPVPGEYQGEIPADENTLNYGSTALRYYI